MALTAIRDQVAKDALCASYAQLVVGVGAKIEQQVPLPTDPWEFCRLCVVTQDEHARAQGREWKRPLVGPGDDYLETITRHVEREKLLRIEKSRQLRVTWLLTALKLHETLLHPGVRGAYQSKKFDDADAYLRDRFWFIYQHIPAKYKKPRARYVSGVIEVFHDNGMIPTSQIMGVAEGKEQLRQYTLTWWWSDEFAFQMYQTEAATSAKPSLDGGGQGILSSSAGGDQNEFYRIGHDGLNQDVTECGQGVRRWRCNGWTTLRVHYTADPNKRGDWAAKARSGYASQHAWDQEQEIDFTITPGKPVFECEKLTVSDQFYDSQIPVLSGMDYSFHANVCISGQLRQRADGKYKLHILTETATFQTYIEPFGEEVKRRRAIMFPSCPEFRDFGDYSANQRTSTGTIIEKMGTLDITLTTVPTGPGGVLKGNELVQHLIAHDMIEVEPTCAGLLQSLRSGYVWQENKRDAKGMPVPTTEHPASDYADAIRYLVTNLFELQEIPGGGSVVAPKNPFRGSEREKPGPPAPPWKASYADDVDAPVRDARPVDVFRGGERVARHAEPVERDAGLDDAAFRG